MIKRTLSTIVLWAIVIGTIVFFGTTGGVVLLAVFTFLAQYEFQGLLEKSGLPPWKILPLGFGFVLMLGGGTSPQSDFDYRLLMSFFLLSPVALVVGALALVKNPAALNRLAGSVLSIAYIPAMMVYYALICQMYHSVALAIWVIAVAKFTDVGGYLVGSAIGKHKLAPSISPGKTWEGVAGGLVLAALVAALGAHFAKDSLPFWLTTAKAAGLALPIGVAAIASDLSESAFKRRAGVKDSGNCIPGIGGALDLADSLLLAGPVAFFLMR